MFMTYTVLSLFFIPTIKWNKHYYVQTSCCGTVYELDPEIGKAIARGEEVEIQKDHLTRVMNGRGFTAGYQITKMFIENKEQLLKRLLSDEDKADF